MFAVREPAIDLGFSRGTQVLAIDRTDSDVREYLSTAAISLYGAIARQEWTTVSQITDNEPHATGELQRWGLIDTDQDRPVARNPQQALRALLDQELAVAQERVARMAAMPGIVDTLSKDFRAGRLRIPGGGSEYLDDQAVVNTRLQEVVGSARLEILASQPGGPRSRALLDIAVARDEAALDRGVEMRTIYRDTVQDHAVTAEYARRMATREGRPAQYRTLPGTFERMIIVDRERAFLSDHIVAGAPAHAAWLVTDPAVIAVLARIFDNTWHHARPWTGELRTTRGTGLDTVTSTDGVRTSPRQREIMRLLCGGVSQPTIAKKLDVAKRTLEAEIAVLKSLWGVHTLNELIYHFATSPDHNVDDGCPVTPTLDDPPTAEETAA